MTKVKFKKMSETAKVPTRGSEYAAGWDLYADVDEPTVILPHSTQMISTGIAIELPTETTILIADTVTLMPIRCFGAIYARSGLASKKGLRPANCTGVIDQDYRGTVYVALHNDTDYPQTIQPQERIAQLIVQEYFPIEFVEVDELSDTIRGSGGFGSSGVT